MRDKFLKRAAVAALEIEEDLYIDQDELSKKIFSIFVAARRWRLDVEVEVRGLIEAERLERKKKARSRDRLSILILTLVVLLEDARAREVLADAEICRVVDGLSMKG